MQRTILIIDDDKFMRDSIASLFEIQDFRVYQAATGKAGLSIAEDVHLDCIIMYFVLSDMDGMAIITALRSNLDTFAVPVIVLSGLTDVDIQEQTLASGANAFLRKPCDVPELLQLVDGLMRQIQKGTNDDE